MGREFRATVLAEPCVRVVSLAQDHRQFIPNPACLVSTFFSRLKSSRHQESAIRYAKARHPRGIMPNAELPEIVNTLR